MDLLQVRKEIYDYEHLNFLGLRHQIEDILKSPEQSKLNMISLPAVTVLQLLISCSFCWGSHIDETDCTFVARELSAFRSFPPKPNWWTKSRVSDQVHSVLICYSQTETGLKDSSMY